MKEKQCCSKTSESPKTLEAKFDEMLLMQRILNEKLDKILEKMDYRLIK